MAAPQLQPETCDVLVVGGGVAGCMAALPGLDQGLNVVLVERSGRLGGKATNAMVGTICGAYLRSLTDAPVWALRDPMRGVVGSITQRSGTKPERGDNGLWYLPYAVERMEEVLSSEALGIRQYAMLNTVVIACSRSAEHWEVIVRHKGTERALLAKTVVDASGNALITRSYGGEVITEAHYQAPSQIVHLHGEWNMTPDVLEFTVARALVRARAAGDARVDDVKHIGVVHGSLRRGSLGLKVTLQKRITGADEHAELNARGRSAVLGVVELLRGTTEAFRNATVGEMAAELGVRTEQRPLGQEILTGEHVLTCHKPANGVAVGAWPIEHWGDGPGADMKWMAAGEHYLIPAGALRSKDSDHLFFAGRGISATEMAIASARVMGTCMATGYAAGMLATYQAMGKPHQEAIDRLRNEQLP